MPPSWPIRRVSRLNAGSPANTSGPLGETPLTVHRRPGYVRRMLRSVMLTTRGHIDLLRVASAACCRGC
ncbi:putative leader peptide [Streptomyces sp. NBC_00079]|uniref:putative leader peptide n=1 Tax=Streptomyces sp. NBC_00079 TaxID=2975644 RepID=UPI00386B7C9D